MLSFNAVKFLEIKNCIILQLKVIGPHLRSSITVMYGE